MLSERRKELLKLIVEEYIKTANPVGSSLLCDKLNCSSATIRNEMASLEDMGYLEKTHTSSGRVPSEMGYRYYVDNLMEPKKMTGEEVLKLQTIFDNKGLVLSDVITRSMEIIISNVPAKVHFFSKILAANLFVIIQCALLGLYSIIGMLLRGGKSLDSIQNVDVISNVTSGMDITGMINNLVGYIPLVLILMAVTLLGYSLLAGILASMTTNMEDFQQLQTPIFVVSLVGFYLAIMNTMFDGAIFIRVLSYVPFISAILSPSLLVTGVIGFKDIILSILLMIVVIYLLLKYGLKIYKEGILNYSSNKLWKKMLKALKH